MEQVDWSWKKSSYEQINPFKAKRKDNGEWVEGYYVYDYSHDAHYIFANIIATPNGVHDGRESFSLEYYEINPNTLYQYTGLTEKNGSKILGE